MALIVEDGTGRSDAESMASVAEADAYATRYGYAAWLALSNSNKEASLRTGTRYLLLTYETKWNGTRLNETQVMPYPATGAFNTDGFALESNVVPVNVKNANIEAAFVASTGEDMLPDVEVSESGSLTSERLKVGPLEIDESFGGGQDTRKHYAKVEGWLKGWVRTGGSAERG